MSVRATQWAWEAGREFGLTGGELLVLLRFADHADHDGVCWPGNAHVAEYVSLEEGTVRRNRKRLAERGLLHWERQPAEKGRGRGVDRVYLHLDVQPGESPGCSGDDQPGIEDGPTGRGRRDQPGVGAQRTTYREPSENHQGEPARARVSVSGSKVTDDELAIASQAVRAFNAEAGTSYSVDAHLAIIVRRTREHPEITAAGHGSIVRAAFRRPWWKDRPSPKVIYGNAAQFESCVEQWRLARDQAGPTEYEL